MCCSPHTPKGGNVSLSEYASQIGVGQLSKLTAGLGWDPQEQTDVEFDLDASAFVVDADGQVLSEFHFVFFNNLESPEGAVKHTGDNRTGDGEGDDEQIEVDLTKLPLGAAKIVFAVSIYDADERGQTFGSVKNAYIRLYAGSRILTRYDLSNNAGTETAMVFGELYMGKKPWFGQSEWKFRAIGQGYANGLAGIARDYGITALA